MKDERSTRIAEFESLQHSYEAACETVKELAAMAVGHGLWNINSLGKRLSALYLRLRQGPVRAVILGQTSCGKSTLINALAGLEGRTIAPESADACSPVPIPFIRSDLGDNIQIRLYHPEGEALPSSKLYNHAFLMQWHHVHGKDTVDDGTMPYVYSPSERLPRFASIVDTPGLNANTTDTDRLFSLFDVPIYARDNVIDLPELAIYVNSADDNLSEEENRSLRRLLDMGMDPERIFIVHNEFCHAYDRRPEDFEYLRPTAVDGLSKSFLSLLQPEIPDDVLTGGDDAFDVFDAFDGGGAGMSEAQAREHIVCLNALFARIHHVGLYDPMNNLPNGCSEEYYLQLKAAADAAKEKQEDALALRDAWLKTGPDGDRDYKPLLRLRDVIDEQALRLNETTDLRDTLRAVSRLGEEIIDLICEQLDGENEKKRAFINARKHQLANIRQSLEEDLPVARTAFMTTHADHKARFRDITEQSITKHDNAVLAVVGQLQSSDSHSGRGFARRLGKILTGGGVLAWNPLLVAIGGALLAMSRSKLQAKFNGLCKELDLSEEDLLTVCKTPNDCGNALSGLSKLVAQMAIHINVAIAENSGINIEGITAASHEYRKTVEQLIRSHFALPRNALASFQENLAREAEAAGIYGVDALLEKHSAARSLSELDACIPDISQNAQFFGLHQTIVSRLDGELSGKLTVADNVVASVLFRCEAIGEARSDLTKRNIRDLVFANVICPELANAAERAYCGDKDAILARLDIILKACYDVLSPIPYEFSSRFKVLSEALQQTLDSCFEALPDPRDSDPVKALKDILRPIYEVIS